MLLPAEITADILSRLPVKALKRFRCVSKSWCKEIESPYFVNMHLQKSSQAHSNLGLILGDIFSTKLYTVDLEKLNLTSVELFDSNRGKLIDVIGSCNGLLALLLSDEKTIALYNPCTREEKVLPFSPSELQVPSGKVYDEASWEWTLYGFGHDPIDEDYKLVKIVDYYGDTLDKCFFSEVKVYSLKSNSWKRIKGYPYYSIFQSEHHPDNNRVYGVFANSAVHWAASTEMTVQYALPNIIVAFDFGVEGFRTIPKPADYLPNEHHHFDLGVLRGRLCLLCTKIGLYVKIWVMKEYGVKESWSKLCTVIAHLQVDPFSFYIRPLAYSKGENKVLLELDYSVFVWYDLRRRKSERVKIRGVPDMVTTEIFVGSLVTLNSGGCRDGKIDGKRMHKRKRIQEEKAQGNHTLRRGEIL